MTERSASTLHERLHDEYESLGMLSYHGGLTPDLWWADLTKADIEEIRELLRDAGAAVRALELVAESKGENLLVDGVIYGPSMYAAHALEKR